VSASPPPWLAGLRAFARQAPLVARVPLRHAGAVIGSAEPGLLARLRGCANAVGLKAAAYGGWDIGHADLSTALALLAQALREAGLAGAWRDERLAVRDSHGHVRGQIERAAVRPLGIATHAVHLVGYAAASGHVWVQQRALDKANDPGLWDTLVGGMVAASDTLEQALARETGEEAGLALTQLQHLRWAGHIDFERPSGDPGGYLVERIDWYVAELPPGLLPVNRDGEVAQFACLPPAALLRELQAGAFTWEATLILAAYLGL